MPPRKPRKKNPAFWLPVRSRSMVMSICPSLLSSISILRFILNCIRADFLPLQKTARTHTYFTTGINSVA